MKFQILDNQPLRFYDSSGSLLGTIQHSGSNKDLYIQTNYSSSQDIIIGNSDTVGDVEFGITAAPVNLRLMGGGTLTSNGNTLYIGETTTNDRVVIRNATFTSSISITGSLSASGSIYGQYFVGDGSGLTNVAAAIAIEDEGVQLTPSVASLNFAGSGVSASVAGGNVTVTIAAGGDTGSFLTTASFSTPNLTLTKGNGSTFPINLSTLQPNTASYAFTASYALNAGGGGSSFPYTGSAIISGSLNVIGPVTASRALISGSADTASGSILTVIGSGSAQPVFTVIGSSGELFSITDSLSGSLFSVNDISGLPILEVFSDSTTVVGDYQAPSLLTTKAATLNVGNTLIYSIPTASYAGAWFDYTITSASNARCGTVMAMRNGSSLVYTETTTTDIGSTADVTFMVMITGSSMALTGSATSPSWSFKSIIRSI